MELKDLVGERLLSGIDVTHQDVENWYGSDSVQVVRFILDGITYEAVEDPEDGYRSTCKELIISQEPVINKFQPQPVIAGMKDDSDYNKNDVLQLFDAVNEKMVLEIGTADFDDYYPYCVLNWMPENMSVNEGK